MLLLGTQPMLVAADAFPPVPRFVPVIAIVRLYVMFATSCPIAKLGVIPVETASENVRAPQYKMSPAPVPEAKPIEKSVSVSLPEVAAGNVTAAVFETEFADTVQPALLRATATRE